MVTLLTWYLVFFKENDSVLTLSLKNRHMHRHTHKHKFLLLPSNKESKGKLYSDVLECEVKWALESNTMNKASGGDGIPVELFQTLKDVAVKVLHSIYQQIWKTQQWPPDWKRSVFIPVPKKGNAKECSNYHTIALISHTSKVMLKILQTRFQQYVNCELPDVQAGFRKGRETRSNCQHPLDHRKSKRVPEKHLLMFY